MRNSILLSLILLIILPLSLLKAQDVDRAEKYFQKAKSFLQVRDFESAEDYLQKTIFLDPGKYDAYVFLGDIYFTYKDYDPAVQNYLKADSLKSNYYLKYKLANSYFLNNDYKEAKHYFERYIEKAPSSSKFVKLVEKDIESCNFAIKSMNNPVDFHPINVGKGINTIGFEYNPVVSVDGKTLIYTGIRLKNGRKVEDFFISEREGDTWGRGKPLPGVVNTNENEGAHCISMDGNYLYFTGCGREEGVGSCDIYVSIKKDGVWSRPINLGRGINSRSWDAHPAISTDGRTLIFSSTRVGGKGDKDLWISTFSGGRWSEAHNIKELNTKGNEVTPFLHADGKTLYFASDGLPGMGGMDFFVTHFDDNSKKWSEPVNLGYGINSSGDQYSLMVTRDGVNAYFAADDLSGFGEMDIYTFKLEDAVKATNTAYLIGRIIDNISKRNIENSSISIVDLKSSKVVNSIYIDGGEYKALLPTGRDYAAIAMSPNYLLYSETFRFDGDSINNYIEKDFLMAKLKKGQRMNLNNINFESGKAEILNESFFELNILVSYLNKYPKYKIKIIGHTDNVGKLADNMTLSTKRSIAVKKYLQEKGVLLSRMKSYGEGESKPISENNSEDGRRKNRRTEILFY